MTLWTVARQVPQSMDSPDKNTGVGSHSLLQGILPMQGLNGSPALQADSLPTEPPGKPLVGEGPGETPSAVRCLSHLISRFLTEIKRLAKN